MYRYFFKRFFDFWISLVALVCVSPLLLIVIIWLHFANKGAGAFFFQERPGKKGRIFKVIKYKTMTDERGEDGELLPDAQRLTKVGKFVRSTSLDELPQLINVLKGDMALIGPRPLLPQYLPFYSKKESERHSVRPGITGWAQVHGRNTVRWDERLAYDNYYVDHLSFGLDLKILFMTVRNVLKRSGVIEVPDSLFENLDSERMKKITHEDMIRFLNDIDEDFNPSLTQQSGSLEGYASKLLSNAKLFFEKDKQNQIKGMVAVYVQDNSNPDGFITLVASNPKYRNQGVVKRLMIETIEYCKNEGKIGIGLFTHNPIALKMYQNLGFEILDDSNEEEKHLYLKF